MKLGGGVVEGMGGVGVEKEGGFDLNKKPLCSCRKFTIK